MTSVRVKFECSSVESAKRKRNRDVTFPGIEKAAALWISSNNIRGYLPSKEKIVAKSGQLATQMGGGFSLDLYRKINYLFIFCILYHLSDYETNLGLACFGLFWEIFQDKLCFVTP